MVRIQLCGRFAVAVEGREVGEALPGRQGRLLLAYLAAHRDRAMPRITVSEQLWPSRDPSSAAPTLTVLLSKIRATIAPGQIRGRSTLQLELPVGSIIDLEVASSALHDAESALALGEWQRAWVAAPAALFPAQRGFLPEFEAPWIDQWRSRIEVMYGRALECHAVACLRLGGTELPGAERCARRLIEHAPLSETGYRLLMEVLAARGDTSAALEIHAQLRRILREELGIDPGPAVRDLHERLLLGTPHSYSASKNARTAVANSSELKMS